MLNRANVSPRWLLLVHQLPAEPSSLRVKTWRRLQGVGAVLVKNSVYVLPNSAERREDFEWIRGEIVADGGEAVVFSADAVDDLAAGEVVDAFVSARRADWQELGQRASELARKQSSKRVQEKDGRAQLERELKTLRDRAAQIDKIDYFRASGRPETLAAIDAIERALTAERADSGASDRRKAADYAGRQWLTRPRPGVDRMASAWLIRRFIDPQAEFRFAERIPSDKQVVPFDMFGVEFGHHGDRCTFETLLRTFDLQEPALERMRRIVHDLDLRTEAAGVPETATVGRVVEGLREALAGDAGLLENGITLFEALYRSFRNDTAS